MIKIRMAVGQRCRQQFPRSLGAAGSFGQKQVVPAGGSKAVFLFIRRKKFVQLAVIIRQRPQKTDAICKMALELKEKGLIDGIGMQSHLDVGFPTVSAYKKALAKFAETGLDIQVTELDITTSDTSEAGFEKQAEMYKGIMDACVC